jgi:hypothetical protein
LDSQRSEYLEEEYERAIDKYSRKEEELHRYHDNEDVPDMEEVLQEK